MPREIAPRIVADPAVRFGEPVIAGTRVPAALIAAKVAGGMPVAEVAPEYALAVEDVRAALQYTVNLRAGRAADCDKNG